MRWFKALQNIFQRGEWAQPAPSSVSPADINSEDYEDEALTGRQGNTPVYINGTKEAMERLKLKPTFTRSDRHRRPHPIEQGAVGLAADRDFQPPPGPVVKPKAGRGLLVLDDGWRPDHQPYGLTPEELSGCSPVDQAQVDRASFATMFGAPYSLTGRDLSG